MAKEKLDPEERKRRRKKQAKYLAIFCVSGFALLFITILVKNYKDDQAEKFRLSSDRNKYYLKAFEDKDASEVSSEFFNEMFLTADNWYDLGDRSSELENLAKDCNDNLSIGVTMFCGIGSAEIDIGCDFSEEPGDYAKYISVLSDKLWSEGNNADISFRFYSDDGSQVLVYYENGEKFLDYFFVNKDLESKWEAIRTTAELSSFKSTEYKEVVLDEDIVRQQMDKYKTVIPYVTDELIKAYNDKKKVKIIFTSDKYIGYEYMSDGMKNNLIDENYSANSNPEEIAESATEGEDNLDKNEGTVGTNNDFIQSDESKGYGETEDGEVENQKLTPYKDLDFNTKEDVYLSPDDYCTYASYVEDNDLNYNSHIKIGEPPEVEVTEEEYYDSQSWVCVFGNQKLMDDISWIVNKLESSNISYQLMYYLYQCSSTSYDLGWGMENLIKNFSK